MNWGGFAGGFAQGFGSGVNMVTKFDEIAKKGEIEKVRTQAMTEAKAAHAADVESRIQDNSQPQNIAVTKGVTGQPAAEATAQPVALPAAPQATAPIKPEDEDRPMTRRRVLSEPAAQPEAKPIAAPTQSAPAQPAARGLPFVVGGKGYATREEARAAAEKDTPDEMHFFRKKAIPNIQKKMIELGYLDDAERLGDWAEKQENQEYARNWMKADQYARAGDIKNAGKYFAKLYGKFDDGISLVGEPEEMKDEGGNITGFKINLRNSEGKEFSQVVTPQDIMTRGSAMLSPIEKFKLDYARQQEADKMAAQSKLDIAKEQRALQIDNYKAARDNIYAKGLKKVENQYQTERDIRQQENAIEKLTIEKQLDAANASTKVRREVGAKVDALRGAGYGDDFINGVLPSLLGVGEYKKAMSPEDAKLKIRGELMANDRAFQKMTEQERAAEVGRVMEFVYGKPGNAAAPRSAAPTGPSYPPVWRP